MFGKHHFAIFGVAALLLAIAAQPLARLKAEARTLPEPATAPALAPPPDVDELARMSRYAPTVLSLGLERRVHLDTLKACPGLAPAHAAGVGPDLALPDFHPFVLAAGKVRLAAAPVSAGCISSSFGVRNGGLHKGVDYFSKVPVPVFAAGEGKVRKLEYRPDYGNMIVIDHGHGVYTRYAHLESFGHVRIGDRVASGDYIGTMGNTASITLPRHLHYEVLTGRWGREAGSFALTPVDVLSLPAAED